MKNYDDFTIHNKHKLIRWLHWKRYQAIIGLINKYHPQSLLDYGAGTGSFLLLLLDSSDPCPQILSAFEPMPVAYQELNQKVQALNLSKRIGIFDDCNKITSQYDMVCCMGVLEHLTLKRRLEVYRNVESLLVPAGLFVVQVPIMTGLGVILRQMSLFFLKGEKPELSFQEILASGLFCKVLDDDNRFSISNGREFLSHRGFDHRRLLQELCHFFSLKEKFCGPFPLPYMGHSFYGVFNKEGKPSPLPSNLPFSI